VAEELNFNTEELLEALGCVNKKNKTELNLSGLILFGTHKAQRTNFPMMRVDYIRVPGNEWLQEPDDRFISIDMRGSAILLLYRLIDAINADLPKGFLLPESGIQAESVGLPLKALREAIVNALMHRSYREHRPIQVIRYDNRIEIINPGYSIKSQDKLGEPGSETRNPFIAAVFHETNLAETKGSGIRAMRRLMRKANLVPPTFESDRENNQFTVRLLLHHFFSEDDLKWLKQFRHFKLTNNQKLALVFVKEVGAIDNQTYRQMADCDITKAGSDLRNLKEKLLLKKKGKAKATYYIAGKELSAEAKALSTQADALSTQPHDLSTQPKRLSTQAQELNTQPLKLSTQLTIHIPVELINEIESLKQKERDYNKIAVIIKKLCSIMTLTSDELAEILNRREDYLRRKYLNRLIKEKELQYKYQEMINHPEQAYKTIKK